MTTKAEKEFEDFFTILFDTMSIILFIGIILAIISVLYGLYARAREVKRITLIDTIGLTDIVILPRIWNVDNINITDVLSIVLGVNVKLYDTIGLTDNVIIPQNYTIVDNIGLSDIVTVNFFNVVITNVVDTININDIVSTQITEQNINLYPPLLTYEANTLSGTSLSLDITPLLTYETNTLGGTSLSLDITPLLTYETNTLGGTSLSLDTPSIAYETELSVIFVKPTDTVNIGDITNIVVKELVSIGLIDAVSLSDIVNVITREVTSVNIIDTVTASDVVSINIIERTYVNVNITDAVSLSDIISITLT